MCMSTVIVLDSGKTFKMFLKSTMGVTTHGWGCGAKLFLYSLESLQTEVVKLLLSLQSITLDSTKESRK